MSNCNHSRTYSKLTLDEKVKIAIYYANRANTRQQVSDDLNVSKSAVTECLHSFIEEVLEYPGYTKENLDILCRRITSKAIGNTEAKAVQLRVNVNKNVIASYKRSHATRKVNKLEKLLKMLYDKIELLRFQLNSYDDVYSSEDEGIVSRESIEKNLDLAEKCIEFLEAHLS